MRVLAAILGSFFVVLIWSTLTKHVVAQYINGSASPVTAGQFCAEMRGWIGMSRAGHTLRSVSCSGGGHEFTVHVRID